MKEIHNFPSTLVEGYNTYSPATIRKLFDGHRVSPFLDFGIEVFKDSGIVADAMRRISVSGVQEKL